MRERFRPLRTTNSFSLSHHIPDAQLIIYPASSHASLFQYPDLFLAHARLLLEGDQP